MLSDIPPIFDAHLHIIDTSFPLQVNQGYLPSPYSCNDYLSEMQGFPLLGGAIVSGSFQGFDQSYLKAALNTLGEGFVGVTQIPANCSDAELEELNQVGIRAVRFNLKRGGSESISELDRLARRVHELHGWHTELYADSATLAELEPTLRALPKISIDHLGLSKAGLPLLLRLVENGAAVKATGFSRGDLDIKTTLQQLHRVNPAALMFGSDLPATRALRRFGAQDIGIVMDSFDEVAARAVFAENALKIYGLSSSQPA